MKAMPEESAEKEPLLEVRRVKDIIFFPDFSIFFDDKVKRGMQCHLTVIKQIKVKSKMHFS